MKNKTVPIVPFKYEYYLYHRFRKTFVGPYKSIEDAVYVDRNRIADTFSEKWYPDSHAVTDMRLFGHQMIYQWREPEWLVVSHLGDIIPLKVLLNIQFAPRPYGKYQNAVYRWKLREQKSVRLIRFKNNLNKIKLSYAYRYKGLDRDGDVRYTSVARRYYRYVKTKNENRQNVGCMADKDFVVRGKRRYHNIPKWDDQSVSNLRYEECWKHNSKRRKQWKAK